jgi:hypothetical protein
MTVRQPSVNAGLRPPPPAADGVDRRLPNSRLHLIQRGVGQRLNALGMHVTVEQTDERAVNLSKREGPLLCHHRVLRIVVVGGTIRGLPGQDKCMMRFGIIRIRIGPSRFLLYNFGLAQILLLPYPK